MSSLARVLAGRAAFVAALLSFACQKDSDALFDNSGLGQPSAGSSGSTSSGAQSSGGDAASGGSNGAAEGGEGGSGAQSAAGGAGAASEGGVAGSSAGSAGAGGKGENGGSAGSAGSAGSGGTKPVEPEPVTLMLPAAADSYVNSCADYTNFGDADELRVDAEAPSNCQYRALLSFALDQIPEGALVSKATLTLSCIDAGGLINAAFVSEAWSEDGVRWDNRPEAGSAIGSMTCEAPEATVTLDLKAAIVAWLSGAHANHGMWLTTQTESGTDLVSSEAATESQRPALSVTYTLPVK